ncbi:MAG: hypothetical protein QF561_01820 [Phycisphaerales bacterium]|jgi:hypothetical protein|nr:hypothetical protein [Phycisphaerales bacterium]
MTMHQIDLMPERIRARAKAGQRVRRTIAICMMIAATAGGAATWASVRADRAGADLVRLETMASRSLELESQAEACGKAADDIEAAMRDYRAVALPMRVSSLVAGIAESLPKGGTLESLTLSYDAGRRLGSDEDGARRLLGTIEGFAATDEDVALLARRMTGLAPFQDVRLEGSRSRTIRGRSARGFSILFMVDMDKTFTVMRPEEVRDDEALVRAEGEGR